MPHLSMLVAMVAKLFFFKKVSNFISNYFFTYFNFFIIFIFIKNQGKQRKMLNIHCYTYHVKKQLCHMNGVRVLTVSD